jgi:toxin FitB
MLNVVDSSCWIEFFAGSDVGLRMKPTLEDEKALIVPTISLFEVHKFLSRQSLAEQKIQTGLGYMNKGQLIDLTSDRAIAASKIAQKHKLAMADAIMYSIALEFNATFWTQDVDYQGLPSVQYLVKR